jgi:Transposase DDE domain group 1
VLDQPAAGLHRRCCKLVLETDSRAVVRFYNKRGTAEQWIKEGKQAVKMTRLSCHRFRSNEVRLWLSVMAYNLGNLWRRLVLPRRIDHWSLTFVTLGLPKLSSRNSTGGLRKQSTLATPLNACHNQMFLAVESEPFAAAFGRHIAKLWPCPRHQPRGIKSRIRFPST